MRNDVKIAFNVSLKVFVILFLYKHILNIVDKMSKYLMCIVPYTYNAHTHIIILLMRCQNIVMVPLLYYL